MRTTGGILALDIAMRTGWCNGPLLDRAPTALEFAKAPFPRPDSGVVQLGEPGCSVGRSMSTFDEWFDDILAVKAPTWVIYESPIFLDPKKTRIETLEKLFGAVAHMLMVLHRLGIPSQRVQPSAVKKSFCGSGAPGKEGVLAECARRDWKVIDDNHADAIAIYFHGIGVVAKALREAA